MINQCLDCSTNERLQGHHVSYEPEEIIILCVDCHGKRHEGHGVGLGVGEAHNKLTGHEQEFITMWTAKFTYYNIMEKFQISIATVRNWANMLKLSGKPVYMRKLGGMKTINVTFEDKEIKLLIGVKGKESWHDFILRLLKGDE